jgi:DNA polymerase/3'-5' exonuclease PolX
MPTGPGLEGGANAVIAARLDEIAERLEGHTAGGFQVRAFHDAAAAIRRLPLPVEELLHERGIEGLEQVPAIGRFLAGPVRTLVVTGHLPLLDRLRGECAPAAVR